jgi:N-acetylglucosaminyldiphosphoundecaprenol N-acetyl-beta-D-mannosaminyltransferase
MGSKVDILGVQVNNVSKDETMGRIATYVRSGMPHHIVTVNPEFIMAAHKDRDFRDVLNRADLALPDGIGLVWACRLLYGKGVLTERVAGVDTVVAIAGAAAQTGWRLYLLGAAEGVAAKASTVLAQRYPGLQIVGTYAGSPREQEAAGIITRIRQAGPDILFVAYGAPRQDIWIEHWQKQLGVPVAMGVGGAFDFIAGITQRAPFWMQRVGLEWLHRLVHEPWRWRRMMALPRFAFLVLWQRLAGKVS